MPCECDVSAPKGVLAGTGRFDPSCFIGASSGCLLNNNTPALARDIAGLVRDVARPVRRRFHFVIAT